MRSAKKPKGLKYREVWINLVVIGVAFLLFTIWYRNTAGDAIQTNEELMKYNKVYLITVDNIQPYWYEIDQGAADMARAIGVNYIWVAPDKIEANTVNRQIELINNAVDDGANALIIAADDPKRISGAVEDAKARGVKIIYVDSPAYEEAMTTLATDNYEAGILQGEAMLSLLDKYKIQGGAIGLISVADKQNTALREAGIRKVLEDDGRFTVLSTVYTEGTVDQAQKAASRLIRENEELVALFGLNQATTEGVGNAIKADNNRIIGVGFDKSEALLKLFNEGSLKALMLQNPYTMGYLGMAEAVAAILGNETGPTYFDTGISVLKSE
jgi:ribose transport system substrate-binding protein